MFSKLYYETIGALIALQFGESLSFMVFKIIQLNNSNLKTMYIAEIVIL